MELHESGEVRTIRKHAIRRKINRTPEGRFSAIWNPAPCRFISNRLFISILLYNNSRYYCPRGLGMGLPRQCQYLYLGGKYYD